MKTRDALASGLRDLLFIVFALGFPTALMGQGGPPIITAQPTNQTVVPGGSVTFVVGVSSVTYANYQWRFNGGNIPGATSSSYAIPSVQVTNAGDYSVAITNAVGYALSSNATLTVLGPPVIVTPPANLVRAQNANATLNVGASGAPPLSFQWRFFGTNLFAGGNAASLTTSNVQAWHSGNYSVVVSNSYGSVTSGTAVLTVTLPVGAVACWGNLTQPASTVPVPAGPPHQAMAAGGAHSLALRSDGAIFGWGDNSVGQLPFGPLTFSNAAIDAGALHSLVLLNDGTVTALGDNSAGQLDIPPGLVKVISISAGGFHNLALDSGSRVYAWGSNTNGECDVPTNLTDVVQISAGDFHNLALRRNGTVVGWGDASSGASIPPPGLNGVAAVSAGAGFSLALRTNGTVVAWGDNDAGETNVPPGLVNAVAISAGGNHAVALRANGNVIAWGGNKEGQVNVPYVFSTMTAISAGANHSLALKGSGAPVFTVQPWDRTLRPGAEVTFAALAVGNASALGYQWRFNGVNIPGATRNTYTRVNVQSPDEGIYSVLATNSVGATASQGAQLVVLARPVLTVLGYDSSGCRLRLSGPPGNYSVEVSPNLTAWFPGLTTNLPPSGTLDLLDAIPAAVGRRFYRAYWQ